MKSTYALIRRICVLEAIWEIWQNPLLAPPIGKEKGRAMNRNTFKLRRKILGVGRKVTRIERNTLSCFRSIPIFKRKLSQYNRSTLGLLRKTVRIKWLLHIYSRNACISFRNLTIFFWKNVYLLRKVLDFTRKRTISSGKMTISSGNDHTFGAILTIHSRKIGIFTCKGHISARIRSQHEA